LKKVRPPKAAQALIEPLARRADALGLKLFVVGGCVRDWMRGRPTNDIDLVCESDPAALAAEAAKLLGGEAEAFGQFGTYRVKSASKLRVDLATARRETYPQPAALPVVATPAPIEEDLRRRDFTVNAMALALNGPRAGELLDPFGGAADLDAGRLRLLHDQSLRDDPTRAFRAARYASRLKLSPDADLERQVRGALEAGHAARLSPHRLTQELLRVLDEPEAAGPLSLLEKWGYLSLFGARLPLPDQRLKGAEERLAGMVVELGLPAGHKLIERLALTRRLADDLFELLRLLDEKRAPRDEVPSHVRRVLAVLRPKLPKSALRPLVITGQDLKELGLQPGPAFKGILDQVAALQWEGKVTTRRQALARAAKIAGAGA
jgi:tRNA nucleotidyltransferase (CCA-adding enzyme)